jgi:putative transposase
MPRQLRIEYPGAIYHLMNRGNQRNDIFKDDQDRLCFLTTLDEVCFKAHWQIHAWCLMRNHFHLLIETPNPTLVAGMKWLLGIYTKRFNIRHKTCGHLFAGRYKSLLVDGSGDGYLRTACDYIHLNPVRAKIVRAGAALETFRWSSYPNYIAPAPRPKWLRVDRLLGEHGIPRDTPAGRAEFARRMQQRCGEEQKPDHTRILERGWCLGSDQFRQELIAAAQERVGPNHYAARRRETEEQKAEHIIRDEMSRRGWQQKDLRDQPKGAKGKIAIAHRLRTETTITLKEIAERLEMGSWTYVSNLLTASRKQRKKNLCQ